MNSKASVNSLPTLQIPKRTTSSYIPFLGLIVLIAIFSIINPAFLEVSNLANILSQSSVLMLVAVGLCFVVVAGGIDLSVAIALDLASMVAILLLMDGWTSGTAIVAALLVGLFIGLLNSFLVLKVKISPFLATLGVLFIGQSIEKIVTEGGQTMFYRRMDETFQFIGGGSFLILEPTGGAKIDFKFSIILALVVVLIAHFLLTKTTFGRQLYAIGIQKRTALLSGVPVKRYTMYAFLISSFICAIAGLVGASSYKGFVPLTGEYYLLDAVGAVFIGSALNKDGKANIPGTVIGVIFFGILANGLNLAGVGYYTQNLIRGALIFIILGAGGYLFNKKK